jgi:hypothetical protein
MEMLSNRITASNRRWTRRYVCEEVGILLIAPAMSVYGHDLVRYRNQTRAKAYVQEQQVLHPLPAQPLAPCRELRVSVSRFSTMVVQGNTYSVPSRLVGTTLLVRVRAEHLEGYLGSKQVVILPRLHGRAQHAINYRHIIWSLVRKPGAFAASALSRRSLSYPGFSPSLRSAHTRHIHSCR